MVRIGIERGPEGRIRGFHIRGHAGEGPRGADIVCAAVSALSQTAILGLEQHLRVGAGVVAGNGSLSCRVPADLDEAVALRAQDVLETMCLGLRAVAAAYPQRAVFADGVRARPGAARRVAVQRGAEAGPAQLPPVDGTRGSRGGDDGDGAHVDV